MNYDNFMNRINWQEVEIPTSGNDPSTAQDFIAIPINTWNELFVPMIKEL